MGDDLVSTADPLPPNLPGFTGASSCRGSWEGINWIMTEDHDGQVELSLSVGWPPRPPKQALVGEFLRHFSLAPIEKIKRRTTVHMVIVHGRTN
jgi:hypothetical protein